MDKKDNYNKKEKKILSLLKNKNFNLIRKANILSTSLFSGLKGGDYLFINKKYL